MENKLWRITIDTNPEDCNLNCIMCEEHSQYSDFKSELFNSTGVKHRRMSKEMIAKVVSEAIELGVKEIIPTTMGDPLVSDSLEYIISLCKGNNVKLNITHNGTFPGKKANEWAALIVPVTSDIKISWNGACSETAERIMKGLNFEKAKINLNEFVKYRDQWHIQNGHYCSVTLQLTFMRDNMNEIEKIIEFAAEVGIDRIKGHHLWIHNTEMEELSFRTNTETKSEWNKIVDLAHDSVKRHLRKDGNEIKLENFTTLEEAQKQEIPYDYDCPFLGKELWISAIGKISPCCAPDKQRDSLGDFGNIENQNIIQTIKSNNYQELLINYKTKELCKTCNMRKHIK
jgi:MoaA/NifB/PqqE/SkfB family radical SAM enzyme